MRKLISLFIFSFAIPTCSFALGINSYFQQGVTIHNDSDNTIMVSDANDPALQNYTLGPGYEGGGAFASDQYTVASGQTFSHTYNIYSAADHSLICTVTSNLKLEGGSETLSKATSSSTKCSTSNYRSSTQTSLIFGTDITVTS